MPEMPKTLTVRIVADTREFRRQMLRAELLFARSWWRRLVIRVKLWRLKSEKAPV